MKKKTAQIVGILGYGQIGRAVARICREAGFKVLVRELDYDNIKGKKVDFLHVNIPEKTSKEFVRTVVANIKELSPALTVIHSSVSVGICRQIADLTQSPVVHSPVIGVHPQLYQSIKYIFPKIIGPVNKDSLRIALPHFRRLGLKVEVFDSSETSEASKLLDLVHYAWDIIFCKWVKEISEELNLDFKQLYTEYNQIYNKGYSKLRPNVTRPILLPVEGPIGGHCTIENTLLFDATKPNKFTKFILEQQREYLRHAKKELKKV